MSIEDAYTRWSTSYDRDPNRTRDLDAEVTREWLGGRRFRSILEIGCGTGKNTEFLATIAERVTAIDFSPGMLRQAQAKVTAENVEFATVDVTAPWPFVNGAFDLAVCNLVVEHVRDLNAVFAKAARCLAPGASSFSANCTPSGSMRERRRTSPARARRWSSLRLCITFLSSFSRPRRMDLC